MLALNRKVLRDFWHMRWQFAAIGMVIGCGVAMLIMAWSMLASLRLTQERYYEQFRFGHVFAHLKRAPNSLEPRITQIPGVIQVETRVVTEVTLDISGVDEPAIGRLISLSDRPAEMLNAIYLREGRLPEGHSASEVVVCEAFAMQHRLHPGNHLFAVLNGKRQRLDVVGVALSPEYVYQVRGGEVLPNDRTFGVFWMDRRQLAAAVDLEGAFNDVSLYLTHDASEAEVIEHLNQALDHYGGLGAYGREIQASNRYVTNELRELRNMGYFAPVVFLVVAAFLLNIVLSRIIGTQQVQIATLKAFGYSRWEIGLHYIKMIIAIVVLGVLIGVIVGSFLGRGMTQMYSRFFHFPVLEFQLQTGVILWSVVISTSSALLGIVFAVRRAMSLPPAVAMQPEPPAVYRPALLERLGLTPHVNPSTRMILRHLERRPLTTVLSIVGLALAVAVMVLGNHAVDAIDGLLDFHFWTIQRHNVTVGFSELTDSSALHELEHLPGVLRVEPIRGVSAQFRFQQRTRRQEILGLTASPQLFRLIDVRGREHTLPAEGLLISTKLAELLSVRPGDEVEVTILEGLRPVARLPVVGLIDDMIGTSAYMRIETLRRVLREGDTLSGAFLSVETHRLPALYRQLKETPRVSGVTSKLVALQSLRDTLAATLLQMRTINLAFASVIACGVVYNSARIALAERARDLASLRVLGYTRFEISYILLGELALMTAAAIPLGLALGYGLVVFASLGYDTELFRIPVVVYRSTYGLAAAVVVLASIAAGLVVRRRLDTLDLVAVLKARE
jgi:putative ABC transport system permease protein